MQAAASAAGASGGNHGICYLGYHYVWRADWQFNTSLIHISEAWWPLYFYYQSLESNLFTLSLFPEYILVVKMISAAISLYLS